MCYRAIVPAPVGLSISYDPINYGETFTELVDCENLLQTSPSSTEPE